MKVEIALPPEALQLIDSLVDLPFSGATTGVVSYADSGELAAVVAFTSPLFGNTFASIAAAKHYWASREFFEVVFHHAFVTLGCSGLTTMVKASNTRSLKLCGKLGFRLEGRMRGFDFGDVLLLGMLKGECQWLGPYQSQKQSEQPG